MKFKIILWVLTMAGITSHGFTQSKNVAMLDKFETSVERVIDYPGELITGCIPTYAFMKISVDTNSKIDRMEISDSADKLFVIEFLSKQKDFNKAALEVYIKDNNLKYNFVNPVNLHTEFKHLPICNCAC